MHTTFQLHLSKGMSGLGLWTIMAFSAMANAANQQPWITERLGITEVQSKVANQTAQGMAKHERTN